MKITKLIFTAGFVILLGVGCAKTHVEPTNKNANKPPAAGTSRAVPANGEFTVHILADGEFDPVTAFVKKGTKVTFKNDSAKAHSIAAYADAGKKFEALDSKEKIAAGAAFSVTMTETGRWLYSDGTNPAFGGAVDVSE